LFKKNLKINSQSSKDAIVFRVLPEEADVNASQSQTILDALLAAEMEIDHSCGGMGSCGTCLIEVITGLDCLPPRTEVENDMATDRQWDEKERLSCQTLAKSGLVIRRKNYSYKSK